MLRHDYISGDHKLVFPTDLFEDLQESITRDSLAEQWQPSVTTESDEMKVSVAVVALEVFAHGPGE